MSEQLSFDSPTSTVASDARQDSSGTTKNAPKAAAKKAAAKKAAAKKAAAKKAAAKKAAAEKSASSRSRAKRSKASSSDLTGMRPMPDRVPSRFSPSRLSDYMQCPKLFYYKSLLRLRTPSTIHTAVGTLAHHAMERIFDLPRDERTPAAAVALLAPYVDEHMANDANYEELFADGARDELLKTATEMVERWFDVEDPTGFDPDGRELHVEADVGGTTVHGYIDRFDTFTTSSGSTVAAISDYKGLALHTMLPTPSGWTTMADIGVGDTVFDAEGVPVNVVAVSDVHERRCFEIRFDVGTVVADDEHRWVVVVGDGADAVTGEVTTLELAELVAAGAPIVIPAPAPLEGTCETVTAGQLAAACDRACAVLAGHAPPPELSTWLSQPAPVRERFVTACIEAAGGDPNDPEGTTISVSYGTGRALRPLFASTGRRICETSSPAARTVLRVLPAGAPLEVRSVTEVAGVLSRCIATDSPTSTFLCTEQMVPTHNTGKVPAPPYQDKAFFAMRIYALLMERSRQATVDRLRLVYVRNGSRDDVLRRQVTRASSDQVEKQIEALHSGIVRAAARGEFPARTSALCPWCHFMSECPAWAPELAGVPILDVDGNPAPR